MKLKSSNKFSPFFLIAVAVMAIMLLSLKSYIGKEPKYPITPEFEQKTVLDLIQVTVKEKDFRKLKKKRDKALAIGVLETSDTDYVPAMISYNGVDFPADVRLKGDWTDHLIGDKWSFRVKLKNDKTIMGMRKFSIHHPQTRGYLNEWLYHKANKDEGLIGLRYGFLEGAIHIADNKNYINKEVGIYAIEETFDKRTIESNGRKESIILKFSEDYWWAEVKKAKMVGNVSGIKYDRFINRNIRNTAKDRITAFSIDGILADTTFSNYFKLGKNLLEDVRSGKETLDKAFDIKKLAMNNALLNLFGAVHGGYIINVRFYYNPITSKLEPIAFDGNSGLRLKKYDHFLFTDMKKDTMYLKELVYALEKVSKPEYLDKLLKKYEEEITHFKPILRKEFIEQVFKPFNVRYNQKIIKEECLRLKKELGIKEEELDSELALGRSKVNLFPENKSSWLSKELSISKQSTALKGSTVFKLKRIKEDTPSYAYIKDIFPYIGMDHEFSIMVRKSKTDNNSFGMRIQGIYPNRVDAIFNIAKGKVLGVKNSGDFNNIVADIKPVDDDWFRCSITTKLDTSPVTLIFGPTESSKPIGTWEGATKLRSEVFIASPSLMIE